MRFMLALSFLFCFVFTMAQSVRAEEPIKLACVGDSITQGAGASGGHSYPSQLAALLGPTFNVGNFGRSGATLMKKGDLPYWTTGEFKKATEFAPNMVVIMLGTNDSKPQNWKNKDQYVPDLTALVEHFEQLPSKPKIWLILPVPTYGTNFGISGKIIAEEVVPMVKQVADAKKLPTIDLFTALSNHADMFPDKVHPNDKGAELMAKGVAEVLQAATKK